MQSQDLMKFLSISLLAAAVACGAQGPEEVEPAADPMEEMAPAAQETLGGGTVTPVHEGMGGSPHVRVDWQLDDAEVSISYGRPYLKDRVVGETVPPMEDEVWRVGADEATTLQTSADLRIGDAHVPAGEYTLWVLDTGDRWELIINEETGQWGTAYDGSHDFARVAMEVAEVEPRAEQLTLAIENGEFRVEWGRFVATVPIEVTGAPDAS